MTKKELIALGLDEDLAKTVAEASRKELEGYVEKSKHDMTLTEKDTLEVQLKEYTKQLDTLKKSAADNENLKAEITKLQEGNKKTKEAYEGQLKSIRVNYAIDTALKNAKAKNAKAVKALLDTTDFDVDDMGVIKGLDKQIKKLQESDDSKFLFELVPSPEDGKPDAGVKPGESISGNETQETVSLGQQMAEAYNAAHVPAGEVQ